MQQESIELQNVTGSAHNLESAGGLESEDSVQMDEPSSANQEI